MPLPKNYAEHLLEGAIELWRAGDPLPEGAGRANDVAELYWPGKNWNDHPTLLKKGDIDYIITYYGRYYIIRRLTPGNENDGLLIAHNSLHGQSPPEAKGKSDVRYCIGKRRADGELEGGWLEGPYPRVKQCLELTGGKREVIARVAGKGHKIIYKWKHQTGQWAPYQGDEP